MSGRSFTLVLFLLVVGLAVFQLISSAIYNPTGLLKSILTLVIVLGAFYLLYKLFTRSSASANTRASYNRAAKQSKRKYAKPDASPLAKKKAARDSKQGKVASPFFKKKRKQSHLTVIEGKKGKKKDRASF